MASYTAEDRVKMYDEAKSARSQYETDWRLCSAYCMPSHYNAWQTDGPAKYGNSNNASRRIAFDTTGARSLFKYTAVLQRLATPHGTTWHGLAASDKALMRKNRVQQYFDQVRALLYQYRYDDAAGFVQATSEVYGSLGTYGTGPMFIGQRASGPLRRTPGIWYRANEMRDIFFLVNDEGQVEIVFRRFFLNVRQFKTKFPNQPLPNCMANQQKVPDEQAYFEFFHMVCPRNADYDPSALDARRHPWEAVYICHQDKVQIGEETGYLSCPYITPRTFTQAGSPYGYAPAQQALAAMGTASSIKKSTIRQGNRASDPVLLTYDDGVMNGGVDQRPGAINPGGVNKDGKKLVQILETGNFNVSDMLLQDERKDIEDSFFVTLFQILTETPEMTATEVIERVAEKAALLSPTMGRLQSEMLGPTIMRELDLLAELGVAPPMPPELIEAKGQFDIIYTSPMAKGIYAEEISGFMRTVELTLKVAEVKQDPALLDNFNFDAAIPEIAYYQASPARWMNDEKKKAQIAEDRAEAQKQQQLLQNAAPIAGALKTAQQMQQGA